jgi:hypothetical protein
MSSKLIWMEVWSGEEDKNTQLFVRGQSNGDILVVVTSLGTQTMFTNNRKFEDYVQAEAWLTENKFHLTAPRHSFE